MATKRTPINRPARRQITPAAVAAFRAMQAATTAEAYWDAHSVLHRELGLKPWHWPAIEHPDDQCPYPAGSTAAAEWQRRRDARPEAFALFEALAEAAAE